MEREHANEKAKAKAKISVQPGLGTPGSQTWVTEAQAFGHLLLLFQAY